MTDYILNLLPLNEEERIAFEAAAPDAVHVYAGRRTVTPEQLRQATILFGAPQPKDLVHCQNLKWFQTMWAGSDEYTAPGRLPEGVTLTNSSGSNSHAVSEHIFACLLAVMRKLPFCRDNQLRHAWVEPGSMKTLLDSTVLVVGAGNVGSAFAARCQAMGAHTIGIKRTVTGAIPGFDEVYPNQQLDEWLPKADVVALVLPHSADTERLMDARRLALMKQDAILLSAGRGSVLDQDALIAALEAGHLWGAALDVTQPEPLPAEHPLWNAPNLLLTPHTAGGMRLEVTRKTCVKMALDNLRRYLAGEALQNVVR